MAVRRVLVRLPETRPPDDLSGGRAVVSFVVILLQFPVDLRGPSHNTDAQKLMLQGTPTPFSRTPRGTGRCPRARHPRRGPARRSAGGAPCPPSCCWAPSCRGHHSLPAPDDRPATGRQD